MEYVLYCDESDKEGRYFENFYGGALVRSEDLNRIVEKLKQLKVSLNLNGELKWQKVTENYFAKYEKFVDAIFDEVKAGKIKIRVMFTQKLHRPKGLTKEHVDNRYYMLYYQFVRHAFGLQFSNSSNAQISLRIYFDWLPDNQEKRSRFKGFILGLNKAATFRLGKVSLSEENITEVDSSKHPILEGVDIILGAMAFRLNDKHLEKPKGSRRRGKRTVAKEKLYKHIHSRIIDIRPGFNIGANTGTTQESDFWNHPYRHWLFKSKQSEIDRSHSKKNKKAPSPLHK